jgi:hypothetical protein
MFGDCNLVIGDYLDLGIWLLGVGGYENAIGRENILA